MTNTDPPAGAPDDMPDDMPGDMRADMRGDMPRDMSEQRPDGWPDVVERVTGSGWLSFAGILILLIGVFKFIEGIWALWNDHYRADVNGATYLFNLTGWGWIHLLLGIVLIATAIGILGGQEWARGAGIGLAAATAVLQLLYLPFFTGSLINILLCVLIIYALTVPKRGAVAY